MMNSAAYQLPDSNVEILRVKVARLARRCEKLGLRPLSLIERKHDVRVRYVRFDREGCEYRPARRLELPCTWIELDGEVPIVEGYVFLARIEHTEAGNMISSPRTDCLGPEIDLVAYRTAKPVCDHCRSARARKDTFLLRTPTGEIVQIGRNCLADYIRSTDVDVAVGILSLLEEISRDSADGGEEGGGGGWRDVTTTRHFLAATCTAVRADGFRPASFERSTKARAAFLSGPRPTEFEAREDWEANQPTEDDFAKADTVIAWSKTWTDTSDYAHNVRIACALPGVSPRHEGVLASAVSAHERAQGREAIRRAEKTATADSAYQGVVKERRMWTLTVLRKAAWDSDFGSVVLHVMADSAGNVFTWKRTSGDSLEMGKTYEVKGTVKKHEEYKGTKQTVLTRCVATAK